MRAGPGFRGGYRDERPGYRSRQHEGDALPDETVKKTYLVTGGAGFIGSHLCERLLADGHEIVCLDNFCDSYDPRIKQANLASCVKEERFHLVRGELLDIGLLEDIVRGAHGPKPETVIHLAALAGVRTSIADPLTYVDVDIKGTVGLLEACRRSNLDRFVFASSSSVYGVRGDAPFSEDDPADAPISPYATAKRAAELYCRTYHALYGIPTTILRFFTAYGPRQRPEMAIHRFARRILAGETIPVYGDGSSVRDYTYVDDVVSGICSAVSAPGGFSVYNLGSGRAVRLSDVIAVLGRVLGIEPRIDPQPMQPGDVPRTLANIDRACREIGYVPGIDFEEGIGRFVEWLTAAGEAR